MKGYIIIIFKLSPLICSACEVTKSILYYKQKLGTYRYFNSPRPWKAPFFRSVIWLLLRSLENAKKQYEIEPSFFIIRSNFTHSVVSWVRFRNCNGGISRIRLNRKSLSNKLKNNNFLKYFF